MSVVAFPPCCRRSESHVHFSSPVSRFKHCQCLVERLAARERRMTKVTETLPQFSSELKSVKVINILVVIFAVGIFVLLGLIPFQFVRLDLTGLLVYVFSQDHDCLLLLLPYCSLKIKMLWVSGGGVRKLNTAHIETFQLVMCSTTAGQPFCGRYRSTRNTKSFAGRVFRALFARKFN